MSFTQPGLPPIESDEGKMYQAADMCGYTILDQTKSIKYV